MMFKMLRAQMMCLLLVLSYGASTTEWAGTSVNNGIAVNAITA
jgi:hypothetical protein